MSNTLKLLLYGFLIVLASISGFFALARWKAIMDRPRAEISELERIEPERTPPPAEAGSPAEETTNQVQASTNPAVTNEVVQTYDTNLIAGSETNQAAASNTNLNAPEVATNQTAEPSAPAATESAPVATALGTRGPGETSGASRIGLWSAIFILSLIGLGFLIAMDVSHFFGNRTLRALYNDEGVGMGNPEYEAAEQVWANGNHLEAIRMMREYLNKNPREQFVALRIAEIYEKDLGNYLAAALEYEEVLKHKLPPERWGWAAIHLCNLYFKLNQPEKAYDLLRRIVKEYPNVAAAEKARKRLEQVDEAYLLPDEETAAAQPVADLNKEPEQPASNLPPGFRPKK